MQPEISDGQPRGAPPAQKRLGLSATALKVVAIVAMFIDHAAWVYVPDYYSPLGVALHFIGRITGPTMFFFIVEGYHHTRNKNRYTLRMAVFALISWLPFIWFRSGWGWPRGMGLLDLSVIYTLLLGLLALRALHEIKHPVPRALAVVACTLLAGFGDWGYLAVIIILLFDLFRGNFRHQALAYCAVVALQVLPPLFSFLNYLLAGYGFAAAATMLSMALVQCGMLLPIVLLALYNGRRGRGGAAGRWAFYVFYPAHLLLLALLRWGLHV